MAAGAARETEFHTRRRLNKRNLSGSNKMADEQQSGAAAAAEGEAAAQQLLLQRVYLKDLSFESPAAPDVFRKQYQPQVSLDLRTRSSAMEDDHHEVVLTITITAKIEEETAFLVEVQQAGIFYVKGIEGEELRRILAIYCPNVLFPYARETIDTIVTKGTYPALMLAQVNFEGLYAQAMQQAQQQNEAAEAGGEAAH
jgi:preprotein translocase subunit SecB